MVLFKKLKKSIYKRIYKTPSKYIEWSRRQCLLALKEAELFLNEHNLLYEPIAVMKQKWPEKEQELFEKCLNHPELHYTQWNKFYGAYNIPANVADQFKRPYIVQKLNKYLEGFKGKFVDYGCGTASLTLAWHQCFAPDSTLILADIPNIAQDFVKWRVKNKQNIKVFDVLHDEINYVDVVLCIDVLEHLRNPSEIFNKFDHKLKKGGLLFLQAPWGGHFTHLDEAPLDWSQNGGRESLAKNYKQIDKLYWGYEVSGVYKKIKYS
jgi:SAM-dependent methyltransferase